MLLRHATTEDARPAAPDHARRLTAEGRREAAAVGEHLRRDGTALDLVLVSPATRARETVEAATPAAAATSVMVARRRGPGAGSVGVMPPFWQKMANACHVTAATPTLDGKPPGPAG